MGLKERSPLSKFLQERHYNSTDSQEFKEKISQYEGKDFVRLNPYFFPSEVIIDFEDEEKNPYLKFNTNLAATISEICSEYKIEASVNDVCFILKRGMIRKILVEINRENDEQNQVFEKEFLELYSKTSNQSFVRIMFLGADKNTYIRITDPLFITDIIKQLRQYYFKDFGAIFIAELILKGRSKNFNGRDYVKYKAMFELVGYFMCETDLFDSEVLQNLNGKVTVANAQAALIDRLLTACGIEEKVLDIQIVHQRVKRLIQYQFEELKSLLTPELYPYLEDNNDLIDTINKILSDN